MKNEFSGRLSPNEIDRLLDEFARNDLSGAEFARQHDLCYGTFCRWRRQREQRPRGSGLPELQPVPLGSLLGGAWAAEIAWPDGPTLRLHASAGSAWARELIEAMRRPC